jgi:hypothetical protein
MQFHLDCQDISQVISLSCLANFIAGWVIFPFGISFFGNIQYEYHLEVIFECYPMVHEKWAIFG